MDFLAEMWFQCIDPEKLRQGLLLTSFMVIKTMKSEPS